MELKKQDVDEWIDIRGYEGLYQMTSNGIFRRLPTVVNRNGFKVKRKGGELKPHINGTTGYYMVNLWKNGKGKLYSVHRLLGIHFIAGRTRKKIEINHINSIRSDNRLENLEWVTPSENMYHGFEKGFKKKYYGASHWRSIAVISQHILTLVTQEHGSICEAARFFKVGATSIWKVMKDEAILKDNYRFYCKKQFLESIKQ